MGLRITIVENAVCSWGAIDSPMQQWFTLSLHLKPDGRSLSRVTSSHQSQGAHGALGCRLSPQINNPKTREEEDALANLFACIHKVDIMTMLLILLLGCLVMVVNCWSLSFMVGHSILQIIYMLECCEPSKSFITMLEWMLLRQELLPAGAQRD